MAQAPVTEQTFTSYSKEQSKTYASLRMDYHESVYNLILSHHESTGGRFDTVMDVGCGPGQATRSLAPRFQHAIGLDPGASMLDTAQSIGGATASGEAIRYATSQAEELGTTLDPPVAAGSIDLITAAAAAHWFDMPAFWRRTAQVLKPGGSVAIWSSGPIRVNPATPNAARIQAAIDKLANEMLEEYTVPGNILVRDGYINLPLPWTMEQPLDAFDKSTFFRKEWNNSQEYKEEKFYGGNPPLSLKFLEAILGTSSPVTRWRQANPQDANTERDPVKITTAEMRAALAEAGAEEDTLKGAPKAVLLIVKKRPDA